MAVRYGAHLPLLQLDAAPRTLADLRAYAARAAALGFEVLAANDHLLFGRPWLDGPSALAATFDAAPGMTIATTVALPVVRGPVQTAKLLAALDILSGGRLIAGVGPGSSARDYAAIGISFEERWRRFDEAIPVVRSLTSAPIWIASWGAPAGLRRVARLGDGWLASGYNTSPARFRESLALLSGELRAAAKSADAFPNAIATMWLYVTDTQREAERMLADVLAPLLGRPAEVVRSLDLPIGPPALCAERIGAYVSAGAQGIFVWPLANDLEQLERFRAEVVPLVSRRRADHD